MRSTMVGVRAFSYISGPNSRGLLRPDLTVLCFARWPSSCIANRMKVRERIYQASYVVVTSAGMAGWLYFLGSSLGWALGW